ncbi:diacylglycerol kinase family protein [Robertkochia marina]|uniref:Diacylglycerol kinase family protein n=1 Tax=Robertkochia marina TaxID=1227945 RepID=A0A4S3M0U1_9FLAO|nr:diacylglycerol kinase family protein [Robertkochia marina]THD67647.1 diacylglycerol kinase family protein [Robertkochia marina]TRZ43379.1 diacylglycerol kinase family protein [Robertkochia marina]
MSDFVKKRIRSIGYASKGAYLLLRKEPSIQVQAGIAVLVTVLGFIYNLSITEWCLQVLCITLVMSAEGFNTAIEEIADFIHPDHHPKIGFIKDIAAGAVSFAAFGAIIVGLIIYIPKIF